MSWEPPSPFYSSQFLVSSHSWRPRLIVFPSSVLILDLLRLQSQVLPTQSTDHCLLPEYLVPTSNTSLPKHSWASFCFSTWSNCPFPSASSSIPHFLYFRPLFTHVCFFLVYLFFIYLPVSILRIESPWDRDLVCPSLTNPRASNDALPLMETKKFFSASLLEQTRAWIPCTLPLSTPTAQPPKAV
jgi:hypothetical protein